MPTCHFMWVTMWRRTGACIAATTRARVSGASMNACVRLFLKFSAPRVSPRSDSRTARVRRPRGACVPSAHPASADSHPQFIDNYAGNSVDPPPFGNGAAAYDIYAGNAKPRPTCPQRELLHLHPRAGPRSSSSTRGVTVRGPRLMGTARCSEREQLVALERWVHEVNETAAFKVVVSSVPLTELFTHDAKN